MNFALLKSFNDYIEANIVKGMLEANDIVCWLQDENQGALRNMPTLEGIKLMVKEDQMNQALNLIEKENSGR